MSDAISPDPVPSNLALATLAVRLHGVGHLILTLVLASEKFDDFVHAAIPLLIVAGLLLAFLLSDRIESRRLWAGIAALMIVGLETIALGMVTASLSLHLLFSLWGVIHLALIAWLILVAIALVRAIPCLYGDRTPQGFEAILIQPPPVKVKPLRTIGPARRQGPDSGRPT